jgi:two-component system, sensor histidine kinase PdtaS
VLLKEIHHRVKNNMQIVCSIFRLQLSQIKDPRAATILRDSQSRISAMALIHKTLYQPKDQSSIYFEEYIQELASSIFDSYRVDPDRIGLKTDLESVAMDIDTVTPCGLILNELVTNSIKYAFPDERQGEIAISFRRDGDGFVLAVSDNGVGLPANFDIHLANTLGMQLVVNLSEKQLGGRLEVESGSQGTTFRIYFRESPGKSKV